MKKLRKARVRINQTISVDSLSQLGRLAAMDHRDLSHELDALVEAEWLRRQTKQAAA